MSDTVKQIIVMRKDLNMRKGKMVAQGAHACMKVLMDSMALSYEFEDEPTHESSEPTIKVSRFCYEVNSAWDLWLNGIFTKICVSVDSEAELLDIYNKALESKIPCSLIEDNGMTEFGGVKTKTCCAIGPDFSSRIAPITGHLKLL